MDYEQTIDTQRLRLLRLVAGWLAAVSFVSACPFSHAVPHWLNAFIASVLSRAELAAQYLVIAQARLIAARNGSEVDPERLLDRRNQGRAAFQNAGALSDLRGRLEALLTLLEDLPRFGLRLLRQTEKRVRRAMRSPQATRIFSTPEALRSLRLVPFRIERPPDKSIEEFVL